MPQPKSSRSSASRRTASQSKTGAAGRTKAAAKGGKTTTAKRSSATATRSTTAAKRSAATTASATDQAAHANLTALRDALRRGVVLSHDAVKTAMDDAVKRGRITRKDATELTQSLLAGGRAQADGFRADLEKIVGKGRSRAAKGGDRVLREVDRARRRVGVGTSFPISKYEDLNATQVQGRLADLSKPELRKVRDYERKHANRKSVLSAIERKLS
jgi:hypothetical protein